MLRETDDDARDRPRREEETFSTNKSAAGQSGQGYAMICLEGPYSRFKIVAPRLLCNFNLLWLLQARSRCSCVDTEMSKLTQESLLRTPELLP
ncbi:hypothetical protein AVEN_263487-1 [Araneus ventricosus]|uniref:Uncharacterized protein n=1 Tax=Araneus ventricosus TaxID=182803 RepID=A0A4Y2EUU5_ARAVE|nr:hypothetical protein AVEN_263487-1 [Araneus ventricosus]